MKSSFWVLCGVVLLCFGSARCKRQFSDNDDNFLDKTGEGDKIRTEKEEDSEWQLYKARTVWNDLTNEIDELSRLQRAEDKCSVNGDCNHDGTCDGVGADGSRTCNCKDGTTGDTCEKITDCETNGKYEKCTGTRGTCGFKDGNSKCECTDEKKLYEDVGYCEVSCEDTPCVGPNRKCNGDKFCVCEDGYEGEACDIVTGCKILATKCEEINTECVFDEDTPEKAVCKCESDFLYERNENKCKKKCSVDGDCQNDGSCLGEDGSKLCKCKDGTTGDKCEKITDCEIKGKYENCTGNRGTCGFEDGNSKCECSDGKQLYDAVGYCEVSCKDTPCVGPNRKCNDDKFCVCKDGYEGEACDIVTGCKILATKCEEINTECVFDEDAPEKAVCKCEGNLVYEREENKCKNPCEGFECKNGGTCEVKNKKATCNCLDQFIGDNCEKDLCEGFECKNGGTCEMKNKKASCKCPDQFIGDKCEKDLCEGFECKNGGTCEMKNKKPSCKCPDQYIGDKCEKDLCAELECKNGGTCVVKNGKAACKCPDQFVGDSCETDRCQVLECKNGGTCEVKNAKAVCKCPDQFTGDNCETDKCADYCKNDGTCEIKDKKPTCKCKDDYAGKQCEQLTKAKCEEEFAICATSNGTCIPVNAEKIICICRTDFAFVEDEGCKERDYCQEICGDNSGVKCIGDKKKKESVTCSCDDENEAFDKTDKECKTDYCKQKCGSVKCEGSRFVESEVQCKCTNADQDFIDTEKKCKTNYCRKVCGSGDHIKCEGEGDQYKVKEQKDCGCDDDEYLYIKLKKYCQKKCSEDSECKNEGTCKVKDDNSKLCNCKTGTTGDTCDVITACETGKYANCKGSRGECTFKEGKPICKCTDDKKLYDALGYCEDQCKEDKSCEGKNRVCNKDNFCVCQDGYEGEDCSIVSGCKELKKKCDEIEVDCVFNKDAPLKATCQCKNDYVYDPDTNKCKNPFCFPSDPCKKPAECSDDEATGIGFCKCPDATYYNYRTTSCENLADKCLLKKTSCGENEVCKNGKCECKYKKEGDECKPKLCTPNPCFANANCSESDGSCFCDAGKYFSNNKKCEKVKCSLTEYKTNCSCPSEMERKDGSSDCVPKKEEVKACDQDCGYGLCISKNKKNYCKCFTDIAGDYKGKCVLKSSFCAGGKLQDDKMKCKCEGQFTQADDGITCRLKTCEDDDVKKECASKGGVCKMQWKGKGYDCECPKGYLLGDGGKCTDPCSLENNIEACSKIGKFCYNSISSRNAGTFECGCPPGIKGDGCSAKAENAYIIKNIPVLKKEYETKSGINKVLLNVDLVKSMELTFSNALFESGYLYDYRVGDSVLNCSVWINFKREPSKAELNAMKLVPRTFSKLCDDCDDSAVVWPPSLLLSEKGLQEAVPDKLGFCSNEVKDLLCGKGAKCDKDKCTCDEGFKIIEYSIKEIASFKTQRCEDIDECALGIDVCSKNKNTICVNTFGSYKCVCKEGFKKKETPKDPETDKSDCYDMCSPSPCIKGECLLKNKTFDCKCQTGVTGSFCDRADEDYKSAKKGTVVVGAVLGTLLAVIVLGVLFYIIKKKKRSGSEDFMPAPRLDHAEMAERRGMRGVSNKAYE